MPGFADRMDVLYPNHTILSMEAAAHERLLDGLALAISGESRECGALYMLGYVVEVLIKTAYYRYAGMPTTAHVEKPGTVLKALGKKWPGQNYHDIAAWIKLLADERNLAGDPIDPAFAGRAVTYAALATSHWRETLRYIPDRPHSTELSDMYESASWMVTNYTKLWS